MIKIESRIIKRVKITGHHSESQAAFDYCENNDLHITWSGPLPIGEHRFDPDKFQIIAEKEIQIIDDPAERFMTDDI